jgi:hypothetical protein
MNRKTLIPLACLSFTSFALAQNHEVYYLKKGDTLSDVLYQRNYKPLYGKQNWVEKIMQLNRLSEAQVRALGPGDAVMIPATEKIAAKKEDKVKIQSAAVMRTGLLGNFISHHQKVFVHMEYFQQSAQVNKTNVSMPENFAMGIKVEGTNNYKLGGFVWNHTSAAEIFNQGSATFDTDENLDASFQPSWNFTYHIEAAHKNIPFLIGPYFNFGEYSSVDQANNSFTVRRDRRILSGIHLKKSIGYKNAEYTLEGFVATSVASQNLSAMENNQMTRAQILGSVNLTQNYYVATFVRRDQFTNSELTLNDAYGARFMYKF